MKFGVVKKTKSPDFVLGNTAPESTALVTTFQDYAVCTYHKHTCVSGCTLYPYGNRNEGVWNLTGSRTASAGGAEASQGEWFRGRPCR